VILYGGYARRRPGRRAAHRQGPQFDFNLFIIDNHSKLTDRVEFWSSAEEWLDREMSVTSNLKTWSILSSAPSRI